MAVKLLVGNYYKNHLMMGDYLKTKYKTKLVTIGFTAFQGEYGFIGINKKLKIAKPNTLEFLFSGSKYDNFLLPLNDLNFENYHSRPLGNFYMTNNISEVMDAVVFNRNMKRPKLDTKLFLKIFPENKNIKPETDQRHLLRNK